MTLNKSSETTKIEEQKNIFHSFYKTHYKFDLKYSDSHPNKSVACHERPSSTPNDFYGLAITTVK